MIYPVEFRALASVSRTKEEDKLFVDANAIEELAKIVQKRGREFYSSQKFPSLKGNLKGVDEQLQAVKKATKALAAKHRLPYDRITTNLVAYPEQSYLMTKEPKTKEEQRLFWATILHYNSPTVVTVMVPNRHGAYHEFEYCKESNFPLRIDGAWTLDACGSELVAKGEHGCQIMKRQFHFSNGLTKESRIVTHFHYDGWPNKMAPPDEKLFRRLVDLVEGSGQGPITVHCAAGRGRSATFVLAHIIKQKRKANAPVDLVELLFLGRLQRDGFLETKEQLKALYNYL